MKNSLRFFVLLLPILGSAQDGNLVFNPSFEKLKPNAAPPICAYGKNAEHFESTLQNWTTFGGMTPDLIIWKPDAYGDCFFPKPHSGENAVGIITYGFREMVQGQLRAPLTVGKKYRIELYVNLSEATALHHYQSVYGEKRDIRPTAAGNLGCYLSYDKTWDWAQKPQVVWAEPIVTSRNEWKMVSDTFIADKAYMYFTIGNFEKDGNTPTTLKDLAAIEKFNSQESDFTKQIRPVAYYCLDDIRIVPADAPPPPAPDISTALKTKKTYTFRNVNFQTAKWELLPPALPELEGLATFLKESPKVKVEIGGHTDDVGNDADNQLLSQNRAEAVANYLISKGIAIERIAFKGYGESQPIAPNTSAAGRLQNRRVECKVI